MNARRIFEKLEQSIPALVDILVNHSPAALKGDTLIAALDTDELQPARLRHLLQNLAHKSSGHVSDARHRDLRRTRAGPCGR